jgi:hypothetical protein
MKVSSEGGEINLIDQEDFKNVDNQFNTMRYDFTNLGNVRIYSASADSLDSFFVGSAMAGLGFIVGVLLSNRIRNRETKSKI